MEMIVITNSSPFSAYFYFQLKQMAQTQPPAKLTYLLYNKITMLMFDIENALDNIDPKNSHVIKKLFYYFNKSSIDGKYAKPYLIKFILSSPDESEHLWSLNDIYNSLHQIPKFLLRGSVQADHSFIDASSVMFPLKKEAIDKFSNFEDEAYDFEVSFGSAYVSEDVIDSVCEQLEIHEIEYDIVENDHIICYPSDAKYQLYISLNGKINKSHAYELRPAIADYKPYPSIGKFNMFAGKPTAIPNDDNLAIFTKCVKCGKHFIANWWSTKGTKCPYCDTNNKLTLSSP